MQTGNGLWGIMTLKGQGRDPNTLRARYLEHSWTCYLETKLLITSR